MSVLAASPGIANFLTLTNPVQRYVEDNPDNEFAFAGWSIQASGVGLGNIAELFQFGTSEIEDNIPFANVVIAQAMHYDFHYRLWVIPNILQLSNPQLNTNIPFFLWNTWYSPQTVTDILVNGSEVLTFDIDVDDVIRDFEIRTVNMQIGPGEPSVEAEVLFEFTNISGILIVIAAISDTFNLIPDVPVRERWEFKTDILTNYLGEEQRISLRRYPRLRQEFDVEIIDLRQRRTQYNLLRKNIVVQSLVPFYQYATPVTAKTEIGEAKIWFDPKYSNVRVGEFLAVVNTKTEALVLGRVNQVDLDGAVLNSAAGEEVEPGVWIAMPAFNCIINDGSGITMNTVTGMLNIKADSFTEPALLRPNATRTVDLFEGTPLLNRRHLSPADELFEYRRDIIDNETGVKDLNSRDLHPRLAGSRKYVVQRVGDPDEMDYWRSLFDTTRGAQKSFLMSTFFPDLTLVSGQTPLTEGVSGFNIVEGEFVNLFANFKTWEHIQIEFPGRLITHHRILSATLNLDGTASISFTPALPTDPRYVNPRVVSYLMRVRAQDTVAWSHYANYSEVSFSFITTDE